MSVVGSGVSLGTYSCSRFRNFLLVGIQFTTGIAVDYNRALWNGLRDLHYDTKAAGDGNAVNFAFVDSGRFFSAIHEWYPMFGYTSSKHCLEGQRASIEDECEDPERTVYYMGAHPSRQTHRILAEYVSSVLRGCWISDDKRYVPPLQRPQAPLASRTSKQIIMLMLCLQTLWIPHSSGGHTILPTSSLSPRFSHYRSSFHALCLDPSSMHLSAHYEGFKTRRIRWGNRTTESTTPTLAAATSRSALVLCCGFFFLKSCHSS